MRRGSLGWTAAALSGIAITAAVTWGASQLFAQPIGLASVPLSVVSSLAPATTPAAPPVIALMTPQPQTSARVTHLRHHHATPTHSIVTVTQTATSPTAKLTEPAHAPTRVVIHEPPTPPRQANPKAPVITQTTTTVTVTPAAPATPGASSPASSPTAPAGKQTPNTQQGGSAVGDAGHVNGSGSGGGDDYGGGDGSDNEGGDGHARGGATSTTTSTANTTTTGTSTSSGSGGGGRDD